MSPKGARRAYKRAKRYLVYLLARGLTSLVFSLPTAWAVGLGALVGRLAGALARPLRNRACAQLEARLGVPAGEARRLASEVFANVGRVGAEIVLLPRLVRRIEAYVELPAADRAVLEAALAEGKGALVVTAHLGNWELLAQRLAATGHEAVTLARKSPNPYIGAWLIDRRAAGGLKTLNRGGGDAIRGMLSALRGGAMLGVLIDQDTAVDSVHVPFFGRPAATPSAAAGLVLRREIPTLAVFIRRTARGHTLSVTRVPMPPEGPRPERIRALTEDLTAHIEAAVRQSPAEWVWFHARWKTPPPEGEGQSPMPTMVAGTAVNSRAME